MKYWCSFEEFSIRKELEHFIVFYYWVFTFIGESKKPLCFKDLNNWSCSIGYGVGSSSPLCPSYNFSLELARSSQVCWFCCFPALLLNQLQTSCSLWENTWILSLLFWFVDSLCCCKFTHLTFLIFYEISNCSSEVSTIIIYPWMMYISADMEAFLSLNLFRM